MTELLQPATIPFIDRPGDALVRALLRKLNDAQRELHYAWDPSCRIMRRPTVAALDKHLTNARTLLEVLFYAGYVTAEDFSRIAVALRCLHDEALARRTKHLTRSKTAA